jgi:hypothetical protein
MNVEKKATIFFSETREQVKVFLCLSRRPECDAFEAECVYVQIHNLYLLTSDLICWDLEPDLNLWVHVVLEH